MSTATLRRVTLWETDTWQWWLVHGFDGIAGGLIGGGATGLAVWATLKSEHRRYDRQHMDEECLRLAGAARKLRHAVQEGDPRFLLDQFDWSIDLTTFISSVSSKEPVIAKLLEACQQQIGSTATGHYAPNTGLVLANRQHLVMALVSVENLLTRRVRDRAYYKRMTPEQCDWLCNAIAQGASV